MSTLYEAAQRLRETEHTVDARAVAAGLLETAAVCSPAQNVLAERLKLAARTLQRQAEALEKGVLVLRAVRGMAAVETQRGSVSWGTTILTIDAAIKVMR